MYIKIIYDICVYICDIYMMYVYIYMYDIMIYIYIYQICMILYDILYCTVYIYYANHNNHICSSLTIAKITPLAASIA